MDADPPRYRWLTWLGLLLVALLSLPPLVAEPHPVAFVPPPAAPITAASKALVVLLMTVAVGVRAWADRGDEPRPGLLALALVGLAGILVACHWYEVDRFPSTETWQRDKYLDILNHRSDAPHQYRPLPYGFTRTLERATGDWWFACVAYRWFFTYWLLWAAHRLARRFLGPVPAAATLAPLLLLYPLSVLYYLGQLTDPLSHALFVLALVYAVEDRWPALLAALALGVLAKESAVVLVPGYLACRLGALPAGAEARFPAARLLLRTFALGLGCVAAFLAVRLPLGWRPGNEEMNGLPQLMVGTNLGIGKPIAWTFVPLYQNYLQPLLFVGPFLPPIAWGWRRLDGRLRGLVVTVPPLLLFSNLCYGWMYESRNYVPLLPLLATAALAAVRRPPR